MSPTYNNSMETYSNYISQFEIFDNPFPRDGFDRHHIVPVDVQKNLYGEVIDNRQIYVTQSQHMWLHILYDRENGTKTSARFLSTCGKPAKFFTCYELCLSYSYTLNKKRDIMAHKLKEHWSHEEVRQAHSQKVHKWWSNEDNRQNFCHKMKEVQSKDDYKEHMSNAMKQRWSSVDARQSMSQKVKEAWTEDLKKIHSDKLKQSWSNEDLRKAQSERVSGLLWWNNGEKCKRSRECPGPEWHQGRLVRKVTN